MARIAYGNTSERKPKYSPPPPTKTPTPTPKPRKRKPASTPQPRSAAQEQMQERRTYGASSMGWMQYYEQMKMRMGSRSSYLPTTNRGPLADGSGYLSAPSDRRTSLAEPDAPRLAQYAPMDGRLMARSEWLMAPVSNEYLGPYSRNDIPVPEPTRSKKYSPSGGGYYPPSYPKRGGGGSRGSAQGAGAQRRMYAPQSPRIGNRPRWAQDATSWRISG